MVIFVVIADDVVRSAIGWSVYDEANWILIDGDMTITHIFLQSTREHYDIEKLWSISEQKLLEISQAAENNDNE